MAPEQFGPYRLEELIGRGGMGEVHRAYDTVRKRTVALKRLPAALAADSSFQARFRRESEVAARLSEPHIVPIHDYGEIDGQLFIDMPLISGVDLESLLAEHGVLEPARAVDIVSQMAMALDAAHARGLVHRDVKPSNVLIAGGPRGDQDFVYLVDFGVARTLGVTGTALTLSGTTVGTLDYMAPERFTGRADDLRVDVYALACVLYQTLTGHKPFTAEGLPALMYAHMNVTPTPPSELQPSVPAAFDDVVARGMAKDPDDRYPSAARLAGAARAALTAPPRDPRTPAPPTTVGIPAQRYEVPAEVPPPAGTAVGPPTAAQAPAPHSEHRSRTDSRRVSRVVSAIGLIAGPLLLTAAEVMLLDFSDADADPSAFLDAVAAEATLYQAAAFVTVVGLVFLVAGLVGLIHLLRGPRVTSGQVGAALLIVAAVLGNSLPLDIVLSVAAGADFDRGQTLALLGSTFDNPWLAPTQMAGLWSVLGLILLAVGTARAAPRWVPALLGLSAVLRTLAGEGGAVLGGVAFAVLQHFLGVLETGLFAVAAIGLAARILKLTDEQWARWLPLAPESPGAVPETLVGSTPVSQATDRVDRPG